MNKLTLLICVLAFSGCATVRQEDTNSWKGQPVSALDEHPIFLTMPVVKTTSANGIEIRNYVNGKNISSCTGSVIGHSVNTETYTVFSNCMASFAACNNIFYIKDGHVIRYVPIGTGGARCYTNDQTRPNFRDTTNL